jgi:hypothetical protein
MSLYLGFDSVSSGVPFVGWAVDTLFPGHALAARALQKDIERRHGRPGPGPQVPQDDDILGSARPIDPAPRRG